MISEYVMDKAKRFVDKNKVRLCKGSTPTFFHFIVYNSEYGDAEVWLRRDIRSGQDKWSCNAMRQKSNGSMWGCMMFRGDQSRPYCSHTLACKLYLDKIRKSRYKEED